MRAKVISAYTDRLDGAVHLPDEVVELTESRAKELADGGFVEAVKPKRTTRRAQKKE